jgi:hypothetical protein
VQVRVANRLPRRLAHVYPDVVPIRSVIALDVAPDDSHELPDRQLLFDGQVQEVRLVTAGNDESVAWGERIRIGNAPASSFSAISPGAVRRSQNTHAIREPTIAPGPERSPQIGQLS